jgi:hypothetical protein
MVVGHYQKYLKGQVAAMIWLVVGHYQLLVPAGSSSCHDMDGGGSY